MATEMVTAYPGIMKALAEPWPEKEVGELTKGGRSFGYLRADQVMQRLDDVLGWENWWDSYQRDPCGSDAVLCLLTVRLPDGRELTKCDLGAPAGMSDVGDDDKSAVSDALKRAAVKFGVGRWLRDKTPRSRGRDDAPAPERLPSQARPPGRREPDPAPRPDRRPSPNPHGKAPRGGLGLWKWAKDQDERDDVGLVKHLDAWAARERLPRKWAVWTDDDAARGYAEAVKHLQSVAELEPAT